MEASLFFNNEAKLACSRMGAFAGSAAIATDLLGTKHMNYKKEDFAKVMDGMNKDKIDWKENGLVALAGGLTFAGKFIPSAYNGGGGSSNWWESFSSPNSNITRPAGNDQTTLLDPNQMDTRPSLLDESSNGKLVDLKANNSSTAAVAKKSNPGWEKAKQKLGCLICTLSFGYLGAKSIDSMVKLTKTRNDLVKSAESLLGASSESVTSIGSGFNASKSNKPSAEAEASSPTVSAKFGCLGPKQSSDAVLNCLAKQVPEAAAIMANPALRNQFKHALKGKDLGDVINNYDDKSSVQDYVAKAMGLPNDFVNKSVSLSANIAEPKVSTPYSSMAYSKAGGSASSEGGFKLSSTVSSNLKDTAFQSNADTEPNLSPEQEIYRRLDLMNPEDVFNDKKISLFIRIAHRYHKRTDALDPTFKPEQNRVIGSKK